MGDYIVCACVCVCVCVCVGKGGGEEEGGGGAWVRERGKLVSQYIYVILKKEVWNGKIPLYKLTGSNGTMWAEDREDYQSPVSVLSQSLSARHLCE